jgi:excisionase family DNA binding protein
MSSPDRIESKILSVFLTARCVLTNLWQNRYNSVYMIDEVLTVADAAEVLGLSPSRVRAMASRGQIEATKIGGRWLIDRDAVESRQRKGGHAGRPFEAHNAWALLLIASGGKPEGVHPVVRSRLRRAQRRDGVGRLAPRLVRRGESRFFDVHPGEIGYLLEDPGFLRTGISAAGDYELELVSGQEADGYVSQKELGRVIADHALSKSQAGSAPVRVRVVPNKAWRHVESDKHAPLATVALDLAEDPDPRSALVGRRLLRDLARR